MKPSLEYLAGFCRLALLLLLLGVGGPVEAARRFMSGFETNNLVETEWDVTVAGTPTVTTARKHSGTYSMLCPSSAAAGVQREHDANNVSGTHTLRVYVEVGTAGSSSTFGDVIVFLNSSGVVAASIQYKRSTKEIQLVNAVTATTRLFTTTLTDDTQYRIEWQYVISDTVGTHEVRLYAGDATTVLETQTIPAEDTLSTNVRRVQLRGQTGGGDFYFDDFAWNDEAGAFQTSWPGPGKIAMLVPAAEGATIQWTPLSGTDNALMVDDEPGLPDDATSYNASSTLSQLDILTLTNMPAEVPSDATIKLVHVLGRVGGNATTGSPRMRFNLYDEADVQTSGGNVNEVDFNGWQNLTFAFGMIVYDAAGKTKANLDSFKAGYEITVDTAVEQRVTALWVNVEWTEFVASACPKTLALLGMGC